ncbi:unnamed protein product [Schistosoma mattheei]|uniref:Uncharacterized protein n=1 Tax=Schistosoma mattheei TaxID=31246 RepID=A0A183P1U1_9TREM|nr:unnamed protein product [Schistosoma mattheei]
MPNDRLPRSAMFSGIGVGWKKARGGQTKTWHKSMKCCIGVGWKKARGGQTKTWHKSMKSLSQLVVGVDYLVEDREMIATDG